MAAADLSILLTAKDEASKILNGVGKSAGGLGKVLGDVGKIAGGFLAANVIGGGVQQLTGFLGDSVAAAKESIAANAQLDAVLKSTGGAAGLTADHIKDLAGSLEKSSLFEDEAILKGQNLLLTFTDIKGTRFDEATQTMLDMAQALGTDASGAAIQLGKALNNPVEGISALSRVGVSFTDQQKEQIKAMQEAGDVAGAQGVILAELNKEFGGSAKAASDAAGASEVYKDKMNDLKEKIGAEMIPVTEKLTEVKLKLIDFFVTKAIPVLQELYVKHWPAVQEALAAVATFVTETLWPAFSSGVDVVFPLVQSFVNFILDNKVVLIAAIAAIGVAVVLALGPVSLAALALAGIITAVGLVKDNWSSFETFATQMWARLALFVAEKINALLEAYNSLPFVQDKTLLDTYALKLKALGEWEAPDIPTGPGTPFDANGNPLFGPSLSGMATGSPFVPRDMLAFIHKGEAVIPAAMNPYAGGARGGSSGGGGGGTVINMDGAFRGANFNGSFDERMKREILSTVRDAIIQGGFYGLIVPAFGRTG
jgi:hypothetical protein